MEKHLEPLNTILDIKLYEQKVEYGDTESEIVSENATLFGSHIRVHIWYEEHIMPEDTNQVVVTGLYVRAYENGEREKFYAFSNSIELTDIISNEYDAESKLPMSGKAVKEALDNYAPEGIEGKSAYEIAVKEGFVGTESEWLESLKGPTGETGADGKDGSENQLYSTTEQAIGTWIDGKTIYRKVVSCGTLPNKTDKTVAHGINDFEHLVNVYGYCEDATASYPMPFPFATSEGIGCLGVWVDSTNITISSQSTYYPNITASYVVLKYTKTT